MKMCGCKCASSAAVGAIMTLVMCVIIEVASAEGKGESHKFTIEELLSLNVEPKDSGDLGLDPCKASKFILLYYFQTKIFYMTE